MPSIMMIGTISSRISAAMAPSLISRLRFMGTLLGLDRGESLDGARGGTVRRLWRACGVCVVPAAGCARAGQARWAEEAELAEHSSARRLLAPDVLLQLLDETGLVGDGLLDQVADRQHADQLSVGQHRQVAQAAVGHQLQAVLHAVARADADH